MSEQHNPQPPMAATLCANNCGFYGNAANNNLCSKCFREFNQKCRTGSTSGKPVEQSSANTLVTPEASPSRAVEVPDPASETLHSVDSQTSSEENASSASVSTTVAPVAPASSEPDGASASAVATQGAPTVLLGNNLSDASADVETRDLSATEAARPVQIHKNRCWTCNKRLGLLGFSCRCGYAFCGEHRYADAHDCDFDYKMYERDQLRKQNVAVIAEKVERI